MSVSFISFDILWPVSLQKVGGWEDCCQPNWLSTQENNEVSG